MDCVTANASHLKSRVGQRRATYRWQSVVFISRRLGNRFALDCADKPSPWRMYVDKHVGCEQGNMHGTLKLGLILIRRVGSRDQVVVGCRWRLRPAVDQNPSPGGPSASASSDVYVRAFLPPLHRMALTISSALHRSLRTKAYPAMCGRAGSVNQEVCVAGRAPVCSRRGGCLSDGPGGM